MEDEFYMIIRYIIVLIYFASFVMSVVGILTLNKTQSVCNTSTTVISAASVPPSMYYKVTSEEVSMFSLVSIISTLSAILCFLLYINTLKVINIIIALILLVINSIVLSQLVNLSNSSNQEIKKQYSISSGISIILLYVSVILLILATVGTFVIYGRHFIKTITRII
jgi:hypothetical protein